MLISLHRWRRTVSRENPVRRAISHHESLSGKYQRLILLKMATLITSISRSKSEQDKRFTWVSFWCKSTPTALPSLLMLFLYSVILFLIGVFPFYLEALPWLLPLILPSTALLLVAGHSEKHLSRLSLAQEPPFFRQYSFSSTSEKASVSATIASSASAGHCSGG